MTLDVARVKVWAAGMKDKAGALAGKLSALAQAGANLEFVVARRAPDKPGTGVVFLSPLKGPAQARAARKAGFKEAKGLHSVRASGPDKPGLGAKMTEALAAAGISLRGLSAASLGKKCVVYFAFDTTADAAQAVRILKKL